MTQFLDTTIRSYIDVAASDAPVPGGGSVSGLAAALGSSMASMAANFTAGKKKFAEVEGEIQEILAALAAQRTVMLECMEEDAVVFAAIGKAYGLPKESDEEKEARKAAIQTALKDAMAVPLKLMGACLEALKPLPRLAEIGNPNLISDTGVAAALMEASTRTAYLNVLINLGSIRDETLAATTREETESILTATAALAAETEKKVLDAISS